MSIALDIRTAIADQLKDATMPYDPTQAEFLSGWVDLAYASFDETEPDPPTPQFPDGWETCGNLQVHFGMTDFIGWAAKRTDNAAQAIIFLGSKDLEWLRDLDVSKRAHPIGGNVAGGMYEMYLSLTVRTETESVSFADYLAQIDRTIPTWVGGHSLGGAFTTFTATDIAQLAGPPVSDDLQVYSFGSPRVGTSDFASSFENLVPNNYRIYNVPDIVPMFPPEALGYLHVNTAEPVSPLDSRNGPMYHGYDPLKKLACYHSHLGYRFMLKQRLGENPNPRMLGDCYEPLGPSSPGDGLAASER